MWTKSLYVILTLALLAPTALAAQLTMSIRYTGDDGSRKALFAYDTIPDHKVDYIVNNIHRLSSGRFEAQHAGSGVMIWNTRSEGGHGTIREIKDAMKTYVRYYGR